MNIINFEIYWVLLTVSFLIWASYEDIKHRLIPDKIWVIQLSLSSIVYIIWFNGNISQTDKILTLLNITLSIIFGFTFFFFGAFGGGDSKAIIVLGVASPLHYSFSIIEYEPINPYPSIIFILSNMLIMFILFAIVNIALNIYEIKKFGPMFQGSNGSIFQKINTLLSARRIGSEVVETILFYDPAEKLMEGGWRLYSPVFSGPMDDDAFEKLEKEMRIEAVNNIKMTQKPWLWMRWQPPGIVFLTLAVVMWIFIGSPFTNWIPQQL